MEKKEGVRTVSITLLVRCGTIHENKENNGAAHFLEHILCKKSSAVENIGGQLDAFTYRTHTRYSINVPSEFLVNGLNILYDSIFNPNFDSHKLDIERGIILSEIKQQIEDNPFNYSYVKFESELKKNNVLGLPILGTRTSIKNMGKQTLEDMYKKYYSPNNMVLSIFGNFNSDECEKQVRSLFSDIKIADRLRYPTLDFNLPKNRFMAFKKNGLQQAYIAIGGKAPTMFDNERYSMELAVNILAGCMSSRVYKRLIEELGLAYTIYGYYSVDGYYVIIVSTDFHRAERVRTVLEDEIKKLLNKDLTENELTSFKNFVKGNKAIMEEFNQRAAENYGFLELFDLKESDFNQKIDSVSLHHMNRTIGKYFNLNKIFTVIISRK